MRNVCESEDCDCEIVRGKSVVCCRRGGVVSAAEDLVGAVWTRFSGLSPVVLVDVAIDALGLFGLGSPENTVLDVRVDRTATGLRGMLNGLFPDTLVPSVEVL